MNADHAEASDSGRVYDGTAAGMGKHFDVRRRMLAFHRFLGNIGDLQIHAVHRVKKARFAHAAVPAEYAEPPDQPYVESFYPIAIDSACFKHRIAEPPINVEL